MIVNPREFNIRLTIGTLISAVAFLVVFGYINYDSVLTENKSVELDKKLLRNELSQLLRNYNELGEETEDLISLLQDEKTKTEIARDSIALLKADAVLVAKLQTKIDVLGAQKEELLQNDNSDVVDSFVSATATLNNIVTLQKNVIETLEEEKDKLNEQLELAKQINANSFNAQVFQNKKSGSVITNRASKASYVNVSFVLAENLIVEDGQIDLYIQILGPDNNVVSDKGSVQFGKDLLIFSDQLKINYKGASQELNSPIYNSEGFEKGRYWISVFHENRKLGSTEFILQ